MAACPQPMWAGAREEWCYWTDLAAIKFPLTYSFRADMDTSFADSKCASGLRATHMQLIQPTPLTVPMPTVASAIHLSVSTRYHLNLLSVSVQP